MQSRRHFIPEFKTLLVLDILSGVQCQAEIWDGQGRGQGTSDSAQAATSLAILIASL